MEEWEARRGQIIRLYRDERKPLHVVISMMREAGFKAT